VSSTAWDWGCFWFCHITHAHARYNSYYPESWNDIQGTYSNNSDFYNRYRYH
jgi:hypothetical protein